MLQILFLIADIKKHLQANQYWLPGTSRKSDMVYLLFSCNLFLSPICHFFEKCELALACFDGHYIIYTNFSSSMQLTDITGLTYQLTLCQSFLPTLFVSRSPSIFTYTIFISFHFIAISIPNLTNVLLVLLFSRCKSDAMFLPLPMLENFIIHISCSLWISNSFLIIKGLGWHTIKNLCS